MKVVVTKMPETPRDCLFSELSTYMKSGTRVYVCTLRTYIPEADYKENGFKPVCICKDCSKCDKLEVLK